MDLSVDRTEKVSMRSTEYRKVIKPLLERRRRARINNCLDELKALIMETTETENADASKLEKADILELTVQHLRNYRKRQQQRNVVGAEDKFRAGFAECAHQVSLFLSGEDHMTKSRLMSHLAGCIDRIPQVIVRPTQSEMLTPTPPPSPMSPLSARAFPVNADLEYSHHSPVMTTQHPESPCHTPTGSRTQHTEYIKCESPSQQYKLAGDEVPTSPVYYSVPNIYYSRKIKTESRSRPWRPW